MSDEKTWPLSLPAWAQVAMLAILVAGFVALCFAPDSGFSIRIQDSPTTTTTEHP